MLQHHRELHYRGPLVSKQLWAMADAGGRLEFGSREKPEYFSLSHFAFGSISPGDWNLFRDFTSCYTSFLSLVPASSVALPLASAMILALAGWLCLLDSGNSSSSCYPSWQWLSAVANLLVVLPPQFQLLISFITCITNSQLS